MSSPDALRPAGKVVKKRAISGSIEPRWPKPRVVRWMEIGAIPALAGLWFPDWLGSFQAGSFGSLLPGVPALPPLLTYVGAVILLIACYEGIKNMGLHFRGVIVSGALSVASAVASLATALLGFETISLLFTGLAAFFASGFLWFTIGKVAEISQESRTRVTWWLVAVLASVALGVWGGGLYAMSTGAREFGFTLLRAGVLVFTTTFIAARYGVHCYKTQTSIGAGFRSAPDDQYWASAK